MKELKRDSKLSAPVGAAFAVDNNFTTEKTMKKLVGPAVDLGDMAGSAGTSTNLGTLIGWYLCVWVRVTTRLVIGMTAETKIFNGKSTTDISKDKANKVVSFLRNSDR